VAVTPPAEALTVAGPLGEDATAGVARCAPGTVVVVVVVVVVVGEAGCELLVDWLGLEEDPPQPAKRSNPPASAAASCGRRRALVAALATFIGCARV